MVFKNGVKNIQAAAYNDAHTVDIFFRKSIKEDKKPKVNENSVNLQCDIRAIQSRQI